MIYRNEKGSDLTPSEVDGNFRELDTFYESFNQSLSFETNKVMETALSQSGPISYTLSATGNKLGTVIRHKIMSDGTNPITFSVDFNVFSKPDNDIYPSGIHIFYFNYVGNEVDVVIPTYNSQVDSGNSGSWSPASLTNGYHWFDFGDSATMTLDGNTVNNITDKIGGMLVSSNPGGVTPTYTTTFNTNKTIFDETDGNLRKVADITTILGYGNDFEGFYVFKNTSTTEDSFISVRVGTSRFAISIRDGKLAVGVYDENTSTWYSKSTTTTFSDITNWYKLRFKFVGDTMQAWLNGSEITGVGTAWTSTDTLFSFGSTVKQGNFKASENRVFFVNNGAMTTEELADANTYCDEKIALG